MRRIRARKAALKEQQVRDPKPEGPATGPCIHTWNHACVFFVLCIY